MNCVKNVSPVFIFQDKFVPDLISGETWGDISLGGPKSLGGPEIFGGTSDPLSYHGWTFPLQLFDFHSSLISTGYKGSVCLSVLIFFCHAILPYLTVIIGYLFAICACILCECTQKFGQFSRLG